MKKILCILLVLVMASALTACGSKKETPQPDVQQNTVTTPVNDNEDSIPEIPADVQPQGAENSQQVAQPQNEATPEPAATPESEATPEPTENGMVNVCISDAEGVNIRSEANTDCEIVGEAYYGQVFRLVSEDNGEGFNAISYNGTTAYISSEYSYTTEMSKEDFDSYSDSDEENESDDEEDTEDNEEGEEKAGVKAETTRENEDGQKR
ncbi:MAG: SH3 domain-containing protein [Clostridia bacterium]|nr:SH3 domain-containing protein [Clostridia bacterium]